MPHSISPLRISIRCKPMAVTVIRVAKAACRLSTRTRNSALAARAPQHVRWSWLGRSLQAVVERQVGVP
jgi:hypothetical protein